MSRHPIPHVTAPALSPVSVSIGAGLRILLAEDDDVSALLTHKLLATHGFEVERVSDGQQAVDAALSRKYDAVLMDWGLPVVGGSEAIGRIRAGENTSKARAGCARLPIIALTAGSISTDKTQCIDAGADAYLTKPFDLARALTEIARLTGPMAGNESTAPPTQDAAPPDASPHAIDIGAMLFRCLGDLEFADQFLTQFATRVVIDLKRLMDQVAIGDAAAVAGAAHTLRGVALHVSATALAELGQQIERCALGDELSCLPPLVDDLQVEVNRCLDAIPGARASLIHAPDPGSSPSKSSSDQEQEP